MIFTAILSFFVNLLGFIFSWLPDASSLPAGFGTAWEWFVQFTSQILWVMPGASVLFTIMSLVILIEGAIFGFKGGNWIYNKLRGSGS